MTNSIRRHSRSVAARSRWRSYGSICRRGTRCRRPAIRRYRARPDTDHRAAGFGPGRTVRVIAGEFAGQRGPAATFTPLNVWDMRMLAGKRASPQIAPGQTAALAILRGAVAGQRQSPWPAGRELVILDLVGTEVDLLAEKDTSLLVLSWRTDWRADRRLWTVRDEHARGNPGRDRGISRRAASGACHPKRRRCARTRFNGDHSPVRKRVHRRVTWRV